LVLAVKLNVNKRNSSNQHAKIIIYTFLIFNSMSYAQNFTSVKKRFHKSKLPSTMEIWDKEMVNSFVLILKVTP